MGIIEHIDYSKDARDYFHQRVTRKIHFLNIMPYIDIYLNQAYILLDVYLLASVLLDTYISIYFNI